MMRIQRHEAKSAEKRQSLSELHRVMVELHDVFTVISSITRLNTQKAVKPQGADDLMSLAFGQADQEDEDEDDEEEVISHSARIYSLVCWLAVFVSLICYRMRWTRKKQRSDF